MEMLLTHHRQESFYLCTFTTCYPDLNHAHLLAWFKKACFVVTVLADLAIISTMDLHETVEARGCRLVTAESAEAKHFEPVRMAITRQQLGRTFSDTFGTSASFKAAVIKKEP
jgi:hypothetical protein